MKTFTCKVNLDLWKHETDSLSVTSPTGKVLKVWYHKLLGKKHWTQSELPFVVLVKDFLQRYHHQPNEGQYNSTTDYWRAKTMVLSIEEMQAFKTLCEIK